MTIVINLHRTAPPALNYVYVGRPSIWGNPYRIGPDGTREDVVRKYEVFLRTSPVLLAQLRDVRGATLGCWCHPLPCHAHVIAHLADLEA